MQSLNTIGLIKHVRRRSDTDFFKQKSTITLLMQHYQALCALMRNQDFYDTYTQYQEKILLSSLPVDLITADILDIESDHLIKLENILNRKTDYQLDKVNLDYLMYWWAVNYERLCTEIPFILQDVEPYFNVVLQEIHLWDAIEDYLKRVSITPKIDETIQYGDLLQSLAQCHQAFWEMFGCKRAPYFIKLIESIRRTYAYWNIPVPLANQLVGALKVYDHSSQRIMGLSNRLQFLQAEYAFNGAQCGESVINAITRNTQKLHEFQHARSDILMHIQGLERFWRLKKSTLSDQYADLSVNASYEQAADMLFLRVSHWLLKREKRQKDNQAMPITVLEASIADDYTQLNDLVVAFIQARTPISREAPKVAHHVHTIYQSSFESEATILDTQLVGVYTP